MSAAADVRVRATCGRRPSVRLGGAVFLWVFALGVGAAQLPSYNVDLEQTSASGISSGGFMSVQLHLAHSNIVNGVGVLAGGPYGCARGSLNRAVGECMAGLADSDAAIARTGAAFEAGRIDDPANLADDKVWLFSGYNDGVVRQGTMNALRDYYRHFTAAGNVFYRDNLGAGHAQVTQDFGAACAATGGRFINDCDYDAAGALLQHIYGRLEADADGRLDGGILEFAQAEFAGGDPRRSGLADSGYVYVPDDCAAGERCRIHVAFHGCLQNAETIGDAFYRHAGYNEWADENRIIVLYPQTVASRFAPVNPQACWDWWGFTGGDYATRDGRQIRAVRAMLERLAARGAMATATPAQSTATGAPQGLAAVDSADDEVMLAWRPSAGAFGYHVYREAPSEGGYVRLNEQPVEGTSYADTGLEPETRHRYAVSANTATGESERSMPVQATTSRKAPPCDPYYANNFTHTLEGRAYALFGRTYALGSNEPMGWWNVFTETNLYRDGSVYRVGTCPVQ